ncbi:hypothetical protein F4803DRAFT_575183 [Xylaria telfairii]|nr:hypothetical protein F4803DRAFT_575183 [Xylaria telfairii]
MRTVSTSTTLYLPLTTIFTPPAECAGYQITCTNDALDDGSDVVGCYGNPFQFYVCRSDLTGSQAIVDCYPRAITHTHSLLGTALYFTNPIFTYKPGLACPLGMTTATSIADTIDSTFCCPSGLTFALDATYGFCTATKTEGTFTYMHPGCTLVPRLFTFGPGRSGNVTVGNVVVPQSAIIIVSADPILLLAQGSSTTANSLLLNASTLSKNTSRLVNPTSGDDSPAPGGRGRTLSQKGMIAIGVSLSVGTVLIISIAFLIIRRHRRKRVTSLRPEITPASPDHHSAYGGKPELEGNVPRYGVKAELDAAAIRAELEGSPGDDEGAGVYVLKPELQGTPGEPSTAGRVYVKKKSELEAKLAPSQATETEVAELGDTSYSKRDSPAGSRKPDQVGDI